MSANLVQFPLEVGRWGHSPRFSTTVIQGKNNQEVRNAEWQDPIWVYNASFAVKRKADVDTLFAFFLNVRGREQSFLVKDFQDHTIPAWTAAADTGNGIRTTFQLRKAYTSAGIGTYYRNITKPKQLEGVGGVRVRVNGAELTSGQFSFSETTGIITIPSPPASGHVVDFSCDEFYVPVRFDVDEIPVEMLHYWVTAGSEYMVEQIPQIPLIEVRNE